MRKKPASTAVRGVTAPPPLFKTQNTNFAASIVATGRLRYCGAAPVKNDHANIEVAFTFLDPDGVGTHLLREYKTGQTITTDPRALFEAQSFLKSEVKRIQRVAGVADVKPVTL